MRMWIGLVAGVAFVGGTISVAETPCATSGPAEVLSCFVEALDADDPRQALEGVLSEDFIREYRASGQESVPDPSNREAFIDGQLWALTASEVSSSSWEFLSAGEPQARGDNEWVIEPVHYRASIDGLTTVFKDGQKQQVPKSFVVDKETVSITVRRVMAEPSAHYVIARWIEDVNQ